LGHKQEFGGFGEGKLLGYSEKNLQSAISHNRNTLNELIKFIEA
jgi:hypothetical protein